MVALLPLWLHLQSCFLVLGTEHYVETTIAAAAEGQPELLATGTSPSPQAFTAPLAAQQAGDEPSTNVTTPRPTRTPVARKLLYSAGSSIAYDPWPARPGQVKVQ